MGTLCCFAVVSVLNLIIIKRSIPNPPRYGVVFFKPLIAAAVMAGAAWAGHGLFARFLSGSFVKSALATLLAIVVGAAVYLIMVLILHVISKEDLELMPKGEKIAKILHIK